MQICMRILLNNPKCLSYVIQAASASKLEGGHETLAQEQQSARLAAPSGGGAMPLAKGDDADDDAELVAAMARVRRKKKTMRASSF